MRLQDLNWMDVDRYLQRDNRVILVTGATVQHGYLSMLTDVLTPAHMAQAVAEREEVLVAPPLSFGVSTYFAEFPGTISLSRATFDAALGEITESLFHQGFTRFFIFNGFGGNQLPSRLEDLHMDGAIRLIWYDWWREEAAKQFAQTHQLQIDHGNWSENFPFNRMTDVPADAKPAVNLAPTDERQSVRALLGDGSFGGPYQVDDVLIQELFDAIVEEAAELVRALRTI
jgi:creatinine amidohydrolase